MSNERTLVERAFDIAIKGECTCASQIAVKLKAEGYAGGLIEAHMDGHSLKSQLTTLCQNAQAKSALGSEPQPRD